MIVFFLNFEDHYNVDLNSRLWQWYNTIQNELYSIQLQLRLSTKTRKVEKEIKGYLDYISIIGDRINVFGDNRTPFEEFVYYAPFDLSNNFSESSMSHIDGFLEESIQFHADLLISLEELLKAFLAGEPIEIERTEHERSEGNRGTKKQIAMAFKFMMETKQFVRHSGTPAEMNRFFQFLTGLEDFNSFVDSPFEYKDNETSSKLFKF